MTQEEKELLLKDLCVRFPYGVKVDLFGQSKELIGFLNDIISVGYDINDYEDAPIEDIKPYLRPMWTMTEEELNEYENFITNEKDDQLRFCNELVFYNRHHFDYRGLIPMGLALEAPEGMYKN